MILQGKIIDETGQGMPSAHITVGSKGTITDINGNYTIEANPKDLVHVSYVGYAPIKGVVKDMPATIAMYPDGLLPEVTLYAKKQKFWQTTGFKIGAGLLALGLLFIGKKESAGLKGFAQVEI